MISFKHQNNNSLLENNNRMENITEDLMKISEREDNLFFLKGVNYTTKPVFTDKNYISYTPIYNNLSENERNLEVSNKTNLIGISLDVGKLNIIDVDNEEFFKKEWTELHNFLEKSNTPKYRSRNNKGFHYLVKLNNAPNKSKERIDDAFDILIKQAPWCSSQIINKDNKIITFDYNKYFNKATLNNVSPIIKEEKMVSNDTGLPIEIINYINTTLPCKYKTVCKGSTIYIDFDKSEIGRTCCFCDKIHSKSNQYLAYNTKSKKVFRKCRSENCLESQFLFKVKEIIKKNIPFDEVYFRKLLKDDNDDYIEYLCNYLYLYNSGTPEIVFIDYSDNKNIKKYIRYSITNFKSYINKYTIQDGTKTIGIFNSVFQSDKLKEIDDIVFEPFKTVNNKQLNIFKGFPVFDNTLTDISVLDKVLYHIKYIICSGQDNVYQYFINRWAYILQKGKCGIAGVFIGDKGTGKSCLCSWFGQKIIGKDNYAYINSLDDITGNFTDAVDNKVYILGDELPVWSGNSKEMGLIKSLITEEYSRSEKKFKAVLIMKNHASYDFLSNNYNIMKVDNGERRFFCLNVSSDKKNDTEYFNVLMNDLNKLEVQSTFYNYLKNKDLNNFNIRNIPMTQYKRSLIESSTPDNIIFLKYLFLHKEDLDLKYITNADYFKLYTKWCELSGYTTKCKSLIHLMRKTQKDFRQFEQLKKRTATSRYYDFVDCETVNKAFNTQYKYFDDDIECTINNPVLSYYCGHLDKPQD